MIEFFFDCSSPWTYLGFVNVQPIAAEFGVDIEWKPILVGGIFKDVATRYPGLERNRLIHESLRTVISAMRLARGFWRLRLLSSAEASRWLT